MVPVAPATWWTNNSYIYGTLRTWALELEMEDAAKLLQTTLDEEQATDIALTSIATSVVNTKAE